MGAGRSDPALHGAGVGDSSPLPVFESDEERTSFVIRLPVHPKAPRTPEVTPEVERVVVALVGEWPRQQLQEALGLKDGEHFRKAYLLPSLETGLVEMTLPDKPRSRSGDGSLIWCYQINSYPRPSVGRRGHFLPWHRKDHPLCACASNQSLNSFNSGRSSPRSGVTR